MNTKLLKIMLVLMSVVFVVACGKKEVDLTKQQKLYVGNFLEEAFTNVDTLQDGRVDKQRVAKIAQKFNKSKDADIYNSIDNFFYGESFESPQDICLKKFIQHFPSEDVTNDKDTIDKLKSDEGFQRFTKVKKDSKILKVDKNLVDGVLLKYTEISSDALKDKEGVIYLKETNSYYFVDDIDEKWAFEPASCIIKSGEIILEDDIKSQLKLEGKNGEFFIKSFEISPNACCE